jgi:hypothetical protein
LTLHCHACNVLSISRARHTEEPDMTTTATAENVQVGTVLVYVQTSQGRTRTDYLTVTAIPTKKVKSFRATREVDGAELFIYASGLKKYTI